MKSQASLSELREQLATLLDQAIQEFGTISVSTDKNGAPTGLAAAINAERLALEQPLKLAIVGRFSSGKSTMLNALLGEDLVPTDVNVTTATVNCFCYGEVPRLEVHWRNGHVTEEPYTMLAEYAQHRDGSQERQAAIDYVNVYHPYPALKQVIIVDTPGLDALIGPHVETTKRMLHRVDAVVYVFNGVPRDEDRSMLTELLHEHRTKTVGVLAKADMLSSEEQERVIGHAMHFLKDSVSDIVPISGKMALAAKLLRDDDLQQLKHISDSLDDEDWEEATFDDVAFQEDLPDILEDVSQETCIEIVQSLTMQGVRILRRLWREGDHTDSSEMLPICQKYLLKASHLADLEALLQERFFKQRDHIKLYQVTRRTFSIFQRYYAEVNAWQAQEEKQIQQLESKYQSVVLKTQRQHFQPELADMVSALNELIPLVSDVLHQKREQLLRVVQSMGRYPLQLQDLMQQLNQLQGRFQVVQRIYETRRLSSEQKVEALRIVGENATGVAARLGMSDDTDTEALHAQLRKLRRAWAVYANQGFSRDEREIGDAVLTALNTLFSEQTDTNREPRSASMQATTQHC